MAPSTIHCKLTGKKASNDKENAYSKTFEKPPFCKYFPFEALCISAFCFAGGTENSRAFFILGTTRNVNCDEREKRQCPEQNRAPPWV